MSAWLITAVEFLAGPIIFLIVLPVIPTIWVFAVYPLFAYRLNHAKIQFSYWGKVGLFYLLTATVCAPALPKLKKTIEHPALLIPLVKSPGFILLASYTCLGLTFHKQINRFASNSPTIRGLKNNTIALGYAAILKLKLAWTNGFNGRART